jgi:hypothetical protein
MEEHLARTWYALFGMTPSVPMLKTFTRFANLSEECSDKLFAALFESSLKHFRTEGHRAKWIAEQITRHTKETPALRAA